MSSKNKSFWKNYPTFFGCLIIITPIYDLSMIAMGDWRKVLLGGISGLIIGGLITIPVMSIKERIKPGKYGGTLPSQGFFYKIVAMMPVFGLVGSMLGCSTSYLVSTYS